MIGDDDGGSGVVTVAGLHRLNVTAEWKCVGGEFRLRRVLVRWGRVVDDMRLSRCDVERENEQRECCEYVDEQADERHPPCERERGERMRRALTSEQGDRGRDEDH
jgi:hypothetical protein